MLFYMSDLQNSEEMFEIPQEVKNFLEGLLKDAGMTTLDDNMRKQMIKELYARLDNYIASVIIDKLPPEYLDEFIRMNEEKKSQAEIEQFLKDKMPNAQEVFRNAFADFRDLYLGNVSVAQNAPASGSAAGTSEQNTAVPDEAQEK